MQHGVANKVPSGATALYTAILLVMVWMLAKDGRSRHQPHTVILSGLCWKEIWFGSSSTPGDLRPGAPSSFWRAHLAVKSRKTPSRQSSGTTDWSCTLRGIVR